MKQEISQYSGSWRGGLMLLYAALLVLVPAYRARPDLVEMQNGDRYVGSVISLDADKLLLQSEVLGKVQLPRPHVSVIAFGANAVTNLSRLRLPQPAPPRAASAPQTNAVPNGSDLVSQLSQSTNLIRQIQTQFLSDAPPEATDKFNELLGGLMTGKLTLDDIRAQASSAADQIRALKGELGPNASGTLDAYLGILDHFLKETRPAGGSTTNAPPRAAKPGQESSQEEK